MIFLSFRNFPIFQDSSHVLGFSVSRTQGLSHISALLGHVSMHHFSKIYVASVANPWPVSCLLSLTRGSVNWGPGPIFLLSFPSTKKYPQHRSSVGSEHEKAQHATQPQNYQRTFCEKLGVVVRTDILTEVWLTFKLKGTKQLGKKHLFGLGFQRMKGNTISGFSSPAVTGKRHFQACRALWEEMNHGEYENE